MKITAKYNCQNGLSN